MRTITGIAQLVRTVRRLAVLLLTGSLLGACSAEGYPDIRTVPERPKLTSDAQRDAMQRELWQDRSVDLKHGESIRRNPDDAPFPGEADENQTDGTVGTAP